MEGQKKIKEELSLTALKNGEYGFIVSVKEEGRRGHRGEYRGWGFKKRLMDMGLTPGTKVMVLRSAPFHGPILVSVRGTRLALGRGLAEKILVEKGK